METHPQTPRKRARRVLLFGVLPVFLVAFAVFWKVVGSFWFHGLAHHGGCYWIPVTIDSPRLSSSMRLALGGHTDATPGECEWKTAAPGFEVAELAAMVDGHEADRIMLARIDPALYRFAVYNDRTGSRRLDEWMTKLGAALVVNGSYYSHVATPDTPFISNGTLLGPAQFGPHGGAFVSSAAFTGIKDLSHTDWKAAFSGAENAMACYPLLISNGVPYDGTPSQWLANRSFVGQDAAGRIIIGTTTDGFFSLYRFARFLHDSPLGLTYALNLDGGPVACQGISLHGFERRSIGAWELQSSDNKATLLTWPYGTFEMPIVLAVFPK